MVGSASLFEAAGEKEALAKFAAGGLFSSNGVSLGGFGLDLKDPVDRGEERWLPVLSTSRARNGEFLSDAPAKFSRIEGGAESGDPSS